MARRLTEAETAVREAAHAAMAHLLAGPGSVHRVRLFSEGGGLTELAPFPDTALGAPHKLLTLVAADLAQRLINVHAPAGRW